MYELIQVSESCYYIQSPAKIGIVRVGGDEVVLIDSGNDRDAGKKVKKHLDQQGWRLRAIYNTHSHADHVGGNRYLQTQTGCAVYAPGVELAFTRDPILEPSFLYGAYPPPELRHKFLMAQESEAQALTASVLPDGWELLPLPGHSFDMVGFRTPDDVVFLADCLSGRQTLEKYRISFLVDVKSYLETLEKVGSMKAKLFIPAHADAAEDMAGLARANMDSVYENAGTILRLCGTKRSFDELLRGLFEEYGLAMTFEQHALVGSTLRSYLTWLCESGRLRMSIVDNTLLWTQAAP